MPDGFNPKPYVGESGVIRVSPFVKVAAQNKVAAANANGTGSVGGNDIRANRAPANASVATNTDKKLPEGVTEADVAEAVAKAEQGDAAAIDWLKTIGLIAGTGAVTYGVIQALKSRKRTTPNSMGADNIAVDAATPNAKTAVAKKAPKAPDLYVDLEADAVKPAVGYLPGPSTAVTTKPAGVSRAAKKVKDLSRVIRTLP